MKEFTCIVCPQGCHLVIQEDAEGRLLVSGNRCPRGALYAQEELTMPKRLVTATCRLERRSQDVSGEKPAVRKENLPPLSRLLLEKGMRPGLCMPQRLPVRTTAPCPREHIPELLKDIYALSVTPPVCRGQVLLRNWRNLGIDVIASRTVQ
ncbi:MAG TPA: DUF1667 domain-containing protein [Termitinemataceae bacterium]|uniref:DUF1667 domain-containing protein n=1 Tax=Treponema sp. J25 TaxID=2094121 RepID=UPI0010F23898|nr:DUF1667 domain-containing protein [Treponema sp. J25]TCW62152.1 hypothetical protein C5O22_02675 [Treponema sp. J25]HOJ98963.1 DUF1667 domain-containing protein [Termitinemataceae bacterium]HOM24559.1 DUF1667 domain-containing protein [Termitinemataceae bacterium]HPQ00228.1 DUF1667 domain-containing protein [Termitinemataceae bacterium]